MLASLCLYDMKQLVFAFVALPEYTQGKDIAMQQMFYKILQ